MARTIAIIGPPSSAGACAAGQELAPAALREAGPVTVLERHDRKVQDFRPLRNGPIKLPRLTASRGA